MEIGEFEKIKIQWGNKNQKKVDTVTYLCIMISNNIRDEEINNRLTKSNNMNYQCAIVLLERRKYQ